MIEILFNGMKLLKKLYQTSSLLLAVLCLITAILGFIALGNTVNNWICIGLGMFWFTNYFFMNRINVDSVRDKIMKWINLKIQGGLI